MGLYDGFALRFLLFSPPTKSNGIVRLSPLPGLEPGKWRQQLRQAPRVRSWFALGQIRYARNDVEGAKAAYMEAARLDPSDAFAQSNSCAVLTQNKETDAAEEFCQRAVPEDTR